MSSPLANAGSRDTRIDVFRGLALVMIFINHMPAQPWHALTLRSWGFSDSAEVFVLLAGMASALAYGRWFARGEFAIGAMAVGARIWTLYLTHLMLFLVVGAIAIFAAERFNETSYLEALGFDIFLQAPASFLGHVLTLTFLPGYLDILPLYVVLLAGLPAVFWLANRHWALPLAVSVTLWLAAQFVELNLPNTRTAREWFFNPAAWQLLFVIGFTIGQRMQAGRREAAGTSVLDRAWLRHSITVIAVAYTLAAFVIAAPWREIPGFENVMLIDPARVGAYTKTDLPLIRLVDTLLKLWLVIVLVRPDARWLNAFPARMFGLMGKHSLEVFAFSTVLAIAAGVAIIVGGYHPAIIAASVIGGTVLMVLLAAMIEWRANRLALLARAPRLVEKPAAETAEAKPAASAEPDAGATHALANRARTAPRSTPLAARRAS